MKPKASIPSTLIADGWKDGDEGEPVKRSLIDVDKLSKKSHHSNTTHSRQKRGSVSSNIDIEDNLNS